LIIILRFLSWNFKVGASLGNILTSYYVLEKP
jgi:hypothetical protein